MRTCVLTSAAAIAIGAVLPSGLFAQMASPSSCVSQSGSTGASAEAIQIQANPPGDRPVTVLPPNPATADTPVPAALPADPAYRAGAYVGALTPPPAEAFGKTYPLCSKTVRDSCVNPSEAGGAVAQRRVAKQAI